MVHGCEAVGKLEQREGDKEMKRSVVGLSLLALLVVGVMPAAANNHGDKDINIDGSVRTRWEYVDNISDADSDAEDSGDFFPYRVRIGIGGMFSEGVSGYAEAQAHGIFGEFSPFFSAQHPFDQTTPTSENSVNLYQGYINLENLGDSDWSLRLGRQEYVLGNELHFGDADFYNGNAFDGLRATRDGESWGLDLFYFITAEDLVSGSAYDDQDEWWGASLDFDLADGDQSFNPYLIFHRDTGSGAARERVYTLGALWQSTDEYDSAWDWSAELAIQSGDVGSGAGEMDVSSSIFEGTLGYTTNDVHRFHLGFLMASGDDDPLDTDLEGFRSIAPDHHANNRLGDLDLFGGTSFGGLSSGISNVTDINLGYTWMGDGNEFRAAIHNLTLTEEIGGEDEIGNEIDLAYDWQYSNNVGFQIGYAHLLSGDLLGTDADDVMRAWWQFHLSWD